MKRWKSLAPGRAWPTPIDALVAPLDTAARPLVQDALESVCRTIEENFPENIFLDLDRIAFTLGETVARRGAPAAALQGAQLVRVHTLFGRQTAIRFRYVHDFLYGFDWARWVSRAPELRGAVGPFDDAFLAYSEGRARELMDLIARDDSKYGPIDAKEHRNPFPFRRDPEAEEVLLRALTVEGAIPVAAWSIDEPAIWDRPFVTLREARAGELGLALE